LMPPLIPQFGKPVHKHDRKACAHFGSVHVDSVGFDFSVCDFHFTCTYRKIGYKLITITSFEQVLFFFQSSL
jgi:hypothetical protein